MVGSYSVDFNKRDTNNSGNIRNRRDVNNSKIPATAETPTAARMPKTSRMLVTTGRPAETAEHRTAANITAT